jgi:energy-coupling factor transport system permease protein
MVFHFWVVRISIQDINSSIILIARFAVLLLSISITTANFSISKFIHGLEDLLSPVSRMKIPIQDFIVSVEIAIRYIPILTITAERIAKAQASRGANWGTSKGSIFDKIRQVVPLILPLFIQSFQKAEKIALAMDSRGYGVIKKRSRYYSSRVSFGDLLFVVVQLLFLTMVIVLF